MGKFLAVLNGAADESNKAELSDERQMEFMAAWGAWAQAHEHSLLDPGSPLFRKKRLNGQSIEDFEDGKVAYTIVEAESHDAAVELFVDHPHLGLIPGNSIEVLECPPIPEV